MCLYVCFMCVYSQWREWCWEDREHQTAAEVPVRYESEVHRLSALREDHQSRAGHRTEQVTHALSHLLCSTDVVVSLSIWTPILSLSLQSNNGGVWKCKNRLQQQLQSLWQVHSASLLSEWKYPGWLYYWLFTWKGIFYVFLKNI